MDKIEQNHLDFLRKCAGKPNSIHELDETITQADADQMAQEGLLIRYNKPLGPMYCIGRYGSQYVKEAGQPGVEMTKLAVKYVVSKGYSEEAAVVIVADNGVDTILKSQAEEMRQGTQREVKVPMNAQGNPEIKFRG